MLAWDTDDTDDTSLDQMETKTAVLTKTDTASIQDTRDANTAPCAAIDMKRTSVHHHDYSRPLSDSLAAASSITSSEPPGIESESTWR